MKNIVCSESESVSARKKRVITEELLKGQEAATQLKLLLEEESLLSSHKELMTNVLRSFTLSLSIINSSSADSGENGSPPVADSGEKRSQKGGRGCYIRRKSAGSRSILSCTTDDNYAWRKYGQKRVLNSDFPRSYFRCCYKYDQGCGASKQVQRDQENPEMYRTTYIGIHTCRVDSPHSTTTWESSCLNDIQDHHHHNNISSPTLTIKQTVFPKQNNNTLSDDDMLMVLKPSNKPTIEPLRMESDTASQCLDMDFGLASVHFGTDFPSDQPYFL